MKLILCRSCYDVVALSKKVRECDCRKSGGRYEDDGDRAVVFGSVVVYGLDNRAFTTGRGDVFIYPLRNGKIRFVDRRSDISRPLVTTPSGEDA